MKLAVQAQSQAWFIIPSQIDIWGIRGGEEMLSEAATLFWQSIFTDWWFSPSTGSYITIRNPNPIVCGPRASNSQHNSVLPLLFIEVALSISRSWGFIILTEHYECLTQFSRPDQTHHGIITEAETAEEVIKLETELLQEFLICYSEGYLLLLAPRSNTLDQPFLYEVFPRFISPQKAGSCLLSRCEDTNHFFLSQPLRRWMSIRNSTKCPSWWK